MTRLAQHLTPVAATPQSAPLPGQVPNSAGGYAYQVDCWTRLDRFLILGSEGGTYYASERKLTMENVAAVRECLKDDPGRTIHRIVEVSQRGLAPKNSPALLALAVCLAEAPPELRKTAGAVLSDVARTGTHLFEFQEYAKKLRGRGRSFNGAIRRWLDDHTPRSLAYQMAKYRQRDGWTWRDLLRLTHPKAMGVRGELYHWAVKGWDYVGDEPHPDEELRQIWAMEWIAKRQPDADTAARMIRAHRLTREMLPTPLLNEPKVWDALLDDMPLGALLRNLPTLTRHGIIGGRLEGRTVEVGTHLSSPIELKHSRIHPYAILVALKTYASGRSRKGDTTWDPSAGIVDALDRAFYEAFQNVTPTGKRILIGLDVSGSMTSAMVGDSGISAREGSAAMAMVTARTEPHHDIVAFSHEMVPVTVSPRQRLDDVIRATDGLPWAFTDCAKPMLYALERNIPVDAFIVYTDNETYSGSMHPSRALQMYRDKTGIPAKLVVVGMTATEFSIADPKDAGMLDVVGFDASAPAVIADFIRG